jgi:general secretion pathway protein A
MATSTPFSLTPDPTLLFETPAIRTVIFKTLYVLEQRQGATAILGSVGLGKSTILSALFSKISAQPEYEVAYLPSPNYPSDFSMLKAICGEFELPPRRSMLSQENELRGYLLSLHEAGKTAVVLIDEAQRLSGKQMELVRVLLNLETHKSKLVQIVLSAQRELENKLRDPSKAAIRSRIFLPSFLSPMSLPECEGMLQFRCDKYEIKNPFPFDTIKAIYDCSEGVPREILKIASAAYALSKMMGIEEIPASEVAAIAEEARLSV